MEPGFLEDTLFWQVMPYLLQGALVTEELDPGLFHRLAGQPERQRMRVDHFTVLLESAIGPRRDPGPA